MNTVTTVDHSAIRTNQAAIILMLLAAFILNLPWLVALVSFVMLFGSFFLKKPGFFWIYRFFLLPSRLVKPDKIPDHAAPHLFAQGFGGLVLLGSFFILWTGFGTTGWALAWLVIALAALNLFGGFCVGCMVYYWLNRLHVPGFNHSSPEGTLPGFRPKRS